LDIYSPTNWTDYPLHLAILKRDLKKVKSLINDGADINLISFNEGSPLHLAASIRKKFLSIRSRHDLELIRSLLVRGADVHAVRRNAGTPLHDACAKGRIDVAELLLASSANINSQAENSHLTPLHYAVKNDQQEMVRFLLSKGAKVNLIADYVPPTGTPRAFTDCGMTPLHIAARDGYSNIVLMLLKAGADIGIKVGITDELRRDNQSLTALELAKQKSNAKRNKDYLTIIQILSA